MCQLKALFCCTLEGTVHFASDTQYDFVAPWGCRRKRTSQGFVPVLYTSKCVLCTGVVLMTPRPSLLVVPVRQVGATIFGSRSLHVSYSKQH